MTEFVPNKKIAVRGQNSTTTVVDEIHLASKDQGTQITYVADIALRHVFWVFTPLIKGDLAKMAAEAEQGMRKKMK